MYNTYVYNFAIANFLWVSNIDNSNMLAVKITGVGICLFSIQDASHTMVCCRNSIMLNKFLSWKNEETVGDFISNIIKNKAELKNLSILEIKAKYIMRSFYMTMGALLQRNLHLT